MSNYHASQGPMEPREHLTPIPVTLIGKNANRLNRINTRNLPDANQIKEYSNLSSPTPFRRPRAMLRPAPIPIVIDDDSSDSELSEHMDDDTEQHDDAIENQSGPETFKTPERQIRRQDTEMAGSSESEYTENQINRTPFTVAPTDDTRSQEPPPPPRKLRKFTHGIFSSTTSTPPPQMPPLQPSTPHQTLEPSSNNREIIVIDDSDSELNNNQPHNPQQHNFFKRKVDEIDESELHPLTGLKKAQAPSVAECVHLTGEVALFELQSKLEKKGDRKLIDRDAAIALLEYVHKLREGCDSVGITKDVFGVE
ncbi:hypothetical protein BJ508DRAFT_340672 [Ascobolus immersus RN42]|uniref:Uncharacterized protein n=1 Tax=Ascobolus immersus RN42 TaxID=1160509 RepID=A0A3N4IDD2_ASCIM|nr:hypothetical protein BJ508DRAFT_340672 [Ascobolus immersus RN42]